MPGSVLAEEAKPSDRSFVRQLNSAFTEVFEKVAPAVVIIEADKKSSDDSDDEAENLYRFFFRDQQGDDDAQRPFRMPRRLQRSEGSGFIIRPAGYIATNNHVIDGSNKVEVRLKDGRRLPAKVVGTDDRTDVAILKIEGANFPSLELGDSDAVKVGQLICAIGIPYNLDYSFTAGWVSAKGRSNLTSTTYEDYIQTDAFINPGNSGGPLFDIDGRVIGMNTLIHGIANGLSFAIPSNMIKEVSDQLISNGKITRPWLGIRISTLDENEAVRDQIKGIDRGVLVNTIEPDAPAYKSDLRPADVITQVDGVSVASARELQREILKKKVAQRVELTVWRNGKSMTVPVTTGELPGEVTKVANMRPEKKSPPKPERSENLYGLQLQDVTKELADQLQLKSRTGALVSHVDPGSPAALADIQREDLITEVNEQAVADAATCAKLIQSHDAKKGILLFIDRKGQKTYSVIKSDE
jgi:Do/DeqQ family serine protease